MARPHVQLIPCASIVEFCVFPNFLNLMISEKRRVEGRNSIELVTALVVASTTTTMRQFYSGLFALSFSSGFSSPACEAI